MEEETEKEADDVESGRKALRAGREIEAVARSVPDLTDPDDPDLWERRHCHVILNSWFEANLNFEENLDGRLLSLGVSVVVGSPEDFITLCHLTIGQ